MRKNIIILSTILWGSIAVVAKGDPIKIAGYPPYSTQNQKIIAKIFGATISYQWINEMVWPDVTHHIQSSDGAVDCAMDMGYTPDRAGELQYTSIPYAREIDGIVFHSSVTGLPPIFGDMGSLEDFFKRGHGKGLSLGGVINAKTGNSDFDEYMMTKKLFKDNQEKHDAFNNREVDAIVIYGNESVSGDIKKVPLDFIEDPLYIACSKSVNPEIIKKMDEAIKAFIKDPSYKETLGDEVAPIS